MDSEAITLNCIAIDDSRELIGDVFCVKVLSSDTIIELKAKILEEGPTTFERWKTPDLFLWRPKDDLAGDEFLSEKIQEWRLNFQTREEDDQAAIIFNTLSTVASQFHLPLSSNFIHVVAQLRVDEKFLGKRKGVETGLSPDHFLDDEVDEGFDVIERWRSKRVKAGLPALYELPSIADRPLSEEEKIPLSKKFMRSLISREVNDICTANDVALLFRTSDYGADVTLTRFYTAVILHPPLEGTGERYHGFWDRNINDIIEFLVPNGKAQRNSNQNTATKNLRPDYAFLLNRFCPFRGEEKAPNSTDDPKAELSKKLEWVYDPAPYVLGYYATGTNVTLAAISCSSPGKPMVHDIAHADLRLRKARILNIRRLINLAGILQTLANTVRHRDAEFEILERDNATIEIVGHAVIKTYRDLGRVDYLRKVYALLSENKVPNVDEPILFEEKRIILSPRGLSQVPNTQRELIEAAACVLETLQVIHAIPLFHRDIRWPNVIRRLENHNKWFLIDWEDAGTPPTLAQRNFTRKTLSPAIFVDGHGAEVDIWGVGGLILQCEGLNISSELRDPGKWMQEAPVPSAQEALTKVKDLAMDTTITEYRPVDSEVVQEVTEKEPGITAVSTNIDPLDDFPEGGLRGWLTVVGSFIMVFATQGSAQSFGVYQDFYTRVFLPEHTPSQIAWIGSIQLFFFFFLGVFVGKLFDDGYFRELLGFGSVLYTFSFFMLSLAKPHQYYQVFLSQGVGVGISMGFLYLPSISVCFHYFKRRKALAVGIASAGGAVGGIAQSIGLNHLLNGKVGFAWGIRIYGFIFLGLFIIANLIMRPRLPPRSKRTEKPPKPDFGIYVLPLGDYTFPNTYELISIVMACVVLISGGLLFSMLAATTVGGLVTFTILYGFFSGACLSLSTACLPAFTEKPSEYGLRFGFVIFVQSFFLLVTNPLAGQLLQPPHYFWSHAVTLEAVLVLVGGTVIVASRILLGKKKPYTWKL
ncbi:hypothetical protein Clacol_009583 [Clathrus columnatus]|uniref:Crinkler effector protein N-terminal domain-containing protein n=1 Tax=Clathrus columnatus TaxID=1419009 RepID=A0AAV5AND9_9AGAM|nr:hypothetical protein Clacol_009583 [Clathrus columnatus]